MTGVGPRFPCGADKKPITRRGFHDARNGVSDDGWPLVGIPTGKVSGFDVLDVDVEGMGWLTANIGKLPPTRIQTTRSGGKHFFFRHVEGVRCSAGRISKCVDVRGDGGYIIAWDREGYPVEEREIAEWPEELLRRALPQMLSGPWPSKGMDRGKVRSVGGSIDPSVDIRDGLLAYGPDGLSRQVKHNQTANFRARSKSIIRKVEHAQPGRRNELLNWGAYQFGQIVSEGLINPDIASLLLEGAAKSCGLWHDDGPQQCRATIKSGIGAGIRDWNDVMRRWP
jgi:hypothetical protein